MKLCATCTVFKGLPEITKSSIQDKSYWKIVLTASDTPPSVWGDVNYFGHWNKIFFFSLQHNLSLSVYNQSKGLFGFMEMCFCFASEKIFHSKTFPIAPPCWEEKVVRTAFSLPAFSLSSQLFHINLKTNDLSLCLLSFPLFYLFSLWTFFGTWMTQKALGW